MIRVEVNDFGPITRGVVELKPLTIFVGPNNSGKSYMAMLMYSLLHQNPFSAPLEFRYSVPRKFRPRTFRFYRSYQDTLEEPEDSGLHKLALERLSKTSGLARISTSELPNEFMRSLERQAHLWIDRFIDSLDKELPRCFGSDLSSLPRRGADLSVSLNHSNPVWDREISSATRTRSGTENSGPLFLNETIDLTADPLGLLLKEYRHREIRDFEESEIEGLLRDEISAQLFYKIFLQFPEFAYYLPAARSGILQSHKLLASAIVRRAPFAGIEPLPTARLTGAIADFISGLLTIDSEEQTDLFEIAELLESMVAQGRVYTEAVTRAEYPEIYYETQDGKFLLHQTSSMVSELAPLVLYLKHIVGTGDLLIIEEPESHLHPDNQRKLAWAIAKMIRKGLKVMLTTHSDFFLSQLSNFVRLSRLEDERIKLGYGAEDYLKPEDVGCYLFAWNEDEDGSVIRELEVDAKNGIPEDEFIDVSESLYNEYVDLERAQITSK